MILIQVVLEDSEGRGARSMILIQFVLEDSRGRGELDQ